MQMLCILSMSNALLLPWFFSGLTTFLLCSSGITFVKRNKQQISQAHYDRFRKLTRGILAST